MNLFIAQMLQNKFMHKIYIHAVRVAMNYEQINKLILSRIFITPIWYAFSNKWNRMERKLLPYVSISLFWRFFQFCAIQDSHLKMRKDYALRELWIALIFLLCMKILFFSFFRFADYMFTMVGKLWIDCLRG